MLPNIFVVCISRAGTEPLLKAHRVDPAYGWTAETNVAENLALRRSAATFEEILEDAADVEPNVT